MDRQSLFPIIIVLIMLCLAAYFTNVYVNNVSKAPIYACYYAGVETRTAQQVREIYPEVVCGRINDSGCPEGFKIGHLDREIIYKAPT